MARAIRTPLGTARRSLPSHPSGLNPKRIVAEGYDRIAKEYLRWRERTAKEPITAYLDRVTERLTSGARVLDLGCGAGVPVSARLSERFNVVGADISPGQLALARRLVPRASFLLADMSSLAFKPASFDGIVALYSIIHVPKEEHEPLLRRLDDFLQPGRRLLAVLGAQAWEGRESDWLVPGAEMYWSHYGPDDYITMAERVGLRVLATDVEPDPIDGAHLFLLAEKPEHSG